MMKINRHNEVIRKEINEVEEHLLFCIESDCIIKDNQKEKWMIIGNDWKFIGNDKIILGNII